MVLSARVARSCSLVLLDCNGSLVFPGSLVSHGSLRSFGTLAGFGSLMQNGALRCDGSLMQNGALGLSGSLIVYGALFDLGSLPIFGSLIKYGSLFLFGSLTNNGSLWFLGSLNGSGSLQFYGSLSIFGSLIRDGSLAGYGSRRLLKVTSAQELDDVRPLVRYFANAWLAVIVEGFNSPGRLPRRLLVVLIQMLDRDLDLLQFVRVGHKLTPVSSRYLRRRETHERWLAHNSWFSRSTWLALHSWFSLWLWLALMTWFSHSFWLAPVNAFESFPDSIEFVSDSTKFLSGRLEDAPDMQSERND